MAIERLSFARTVTVIAIYAAFSTAWIAFSDYAVGLWISDVEQLVLVGTLKGAVYVVLSGALLFWLVRGQRRSPTGAGPRPASTRSWPGWAILLGGLLLMALGYAVAYEGERERSEAVLVAMSQTKTQQLRQWLDERETSARYFLNELADSVASQPAVFHRHFGRIAATAPYQGALWLDARGRVLQSQGRVVMGRGAWRLQAAFNEAVTKGHPAWVAEVDDAGNKQLFVVAAHADGSTGLVLVMDAATSLTPILSTLPGAGETAEAVLFTVRGDDIVFLVTPRLAAAAQQDETLRVRQPGLLSAMVIRGEVPFSTTVEAYDYRNQSVIGAVDHVQPGRPTYLLVKMDRAELHANLAQQVIWIVLAGIALIAAAFSLWITSLQRRKLLLAEIDARAQDVEVRAARSVMDSEAALRQAQAIAHMGSWQWRSGSDALKCSDEWCRIMDLSRGQPVTARQVIQRTHPEDRAALLAAWRDALESGHFEFEHRVRANGGSRWVCQRAQLVRDAGGAVIEANGTLQDVTERKALQSRIEQGERRLRVAQHAGHVGIWERGPHDGTAYWSAEAERLYGVAPGTLKTIEQWRARVHPGDLNRLDTAVHDALFLGRPIDVEFRVPLPSGRVRWLHSRGAVRNDGPDGPMLVSGIVIDITDRKETEERIRLHARCLNCVGEAAAKFAYTASERDFGANVLAFMEELSTLLHFDRGYIFEFSPDMATARNTYEWCADGISHQIDNLDCVRREEMPWFWEQIQRGREVDIRKASDLPAEAELDRQVFIAQDIRSLVCLPMHATSERLAGFIGFDFVRAIHGWPDELVRVLAIAADVIGAAQARVVAQARLAESRKRLEDVLWGTGAGTWRWNVQTGETQFNARWAEIVGYSLEELGETSIDTWGRLAHPDDLPVSQAALDAHFSGKTDLYECEVRMRHRDGRWVWVLDRGRVTSRTPDGKPQWMSGTHMDITVRKQAQLEVEDAHQRLNKLAARVPGMIYQYQQWPDGRVAFPYSSEGIRQIYELAPEDVAQDASIVMSRLHPDDLAQILKSIEHSAKTLETWCLTYRVVGEDGKVKWVEGQSEPEAMPDGSVLWHGHIRDVTDRRLAEHKLRTLSMAIEQSPESIVIAGLDGSIEFVNRAFIETAGYAEQELIGNNPRILQSGLTPHATYEAMWGALTAGRSWRGELINRRRNGEIYTEYAVVTPIRDDSGRVYCYLAIKDDITEKKRMGEELSAYRVHLEELVATRTAQLAEARRRAEVASIAKGAFLANMSHEIRTPINAILGLTHLLARDAMTAEQERRVKQLEVSGKHLLSLINDILDISKIEAGSLSLEQRPFSLRQMVDQVASMLAPAAADKGLALTQHVDCVEDWCVGDVTRLRQALINYANNAIKFTHAGFVQLGCEALETDAGRIHLRFWVKDSGVGISEDAQKRLFQVFEQADATITRRFGGTGLGLAIVKHLALMMEGDVGVDSIVGQGSTFWFTVWLNLGAPDEIARSQHGDAPGEWILKPDIARVLLVDDNQINREVASDILADLGLSVDTAENGQEAIDALAGASYDLVFMDMQMPVLDGLSATVRIRESPQHAAMPIIAMTANAFEEDRRACLAAGMNDFLSKPIQIDHLKSILTHWLPPSLFEPSADDSVTSGPSEFIADEEAILSLLRSRSDIDLDQGLAVVNDDLSRYLMVVGKFLVNHRNDVARIRAAMNSKDWVTARRLAHSLKGASAMVGLRAISDVASAVEQRFADLGSQDDIDSTSIESLLRALQEPLVDADAWLARIEQEDEAPHKHVDLDRMEQVKSELLGLLSRSDARALTLFRAHEALLAKMLGSRATEFAAAMSRFEFPQAKSLLADM